MHIYVVKKTDNMPSQFLPIHQWSHGNSCTWAHDVINCIINCTSSILNSQVAISHYGDKLDSTLVLVYAIYMKRFLNRQINK